MKFGDKLFLYGQFMDQEHWDDLGFGNPQYNSVMGYMPVGGYGITPQKTDIVAACLPGYVVDFWGQRDSLASAAPFAHDELEDVTHLLSLQVPSAEGQRVWMPVGLSVKDGLQLHPVPSTQL